MASMATPDPEPLEKEVVPLPDGRRLILYRFPDPPAGPGARPGRTPAADPPPDGER
jgi:hypothetical protein